ncbi:MAG: flagellar biosynthetic protein FliR [Alphaproteobacteria bacterium]|nr:flagellar biosynthetic protein FliR [Alphaproteobacteria bacterium]
MHTYHLDAFLSGHVFAFVLLLSRIGSVMLLFPGIGEHYVSARARLFFACLICLLLLEPMLPRLPALPSAPAEMARMVGYEVIVGLFFGTLVRLVFGALESTGMIIGFTTGLSNATMMNPALATQSPLPSAFLTAAGLALIFITGMDHFLIRTTVALYDIFPAGGTLMTGDIAKTVINVTNQSFVVGVELATPFLVMSLLLYAAMGIIQRLLPSVQVFMVMLPIQIWGGLMMFLLTIAGILTIWLRYMDQSVGSFFQG